MVSDVLLNKVAIIERCVARVEAVYIEGRAVVSAAKSAEVALSIRKS